MRLLFVLFAALAVLILAAPPALADADSDLDGYREVGAGFYEKGGQYFTRQPYYYGWYSPNWTGYGPYSQYAKTYPRYYWWQYSSVSLPVSSLTPYSSEKDWIAFLASRERVQGKIAASKAAHAAFMEKLKAVGVTQPYPQLPAYEANHSSSVYGNNGSLQLGSYGSSGSTIFGYQNTKYTQVADLYSPIDTAVLFQQSAALVRGAQGLAGDANTALSSRLQEINAGMARVAEIKAQSDADLAKLRALQVNRITTTVNTTSPTVLTPPATPQGPAVMPPVAEDGPAATRVLASATAKTACYSCHSGGKPAGGLDISKGMTAEQFLKVVNRVTLPLSDPKHMPAPVAGAQARQLSSTEIKDLLP